MANRKATLIRCAKVPGLGWLRGSLVKTKNGRIKPDYMMHKEGTILLESPRSRTQQKCDYP
ncbi:MAG: hypothetical protein ABSE93_16550 [Terriglobia bacterium]|jgi:hypothetical protein